MYRLRLRPHCDQDLSPALEKHGIAKSLTFSDKISGAKNERPGLKKCLDSLQEGDALIVWRLDLLTRLPQSAT